MLLHATLLALAASAPQESDFVVPQGFAVERVSDVAKSYLALTFDHRGRIFVSVEGGPILAFEDKDLDGKFETSSVFSDDVASAQGLVWLDHVLYAVGDSHGKLGVFRLTPNADETKAAKCELVVPVVGANGDEAPGEHGAHGIVVGPDGFLYLMLGNYAKLGTEPSKDSPLREGYEGNVLPRLDDPLGFGAHVKYPCGYVARIDPKSGEWRYVCVGLRNCYDLAFNAEGELFSFDSDMEWDLGLPWYRPTRFLHLVEGGDYGSRAGSSVWPDYYFDSLPSIVDVGRGSPTGLVFYDHERFPAKYRGALLAGDWSQGRILALHLKPNGATYSGEVETLVQAKSGFNVTDLDVGPDGALYFVSGGRGVIGHIERLIYRDNSAPAIVEDFDPNAPWVMPWSAHTRELIHSMRAQSGDAWFAKAREVATKDDPRASNATITTGRGNTLDYYAREGGPNALEVMSNAAHSSSAAVRARAAYWLGRRVESHPTLEVGRQLLDLIVDPDARVERVACEALMHFDIAVDQSWLKKYENTFALTPMQHADRWVRFAAQQALRRSGIFILEAPESFNSLSEQLQDRFLSDLPFEALLLSWAERDGYEPRTRSLGVAELRPCDLRERPLDRLRLDERLLERDGFDRIETTRLNEYHEWLTRQFPSGDRRVSAELAILLAHLGFDGSIEKLLVALRLESDHAQQIHYAYCLCSIEKGWTHDEARKLFDWFDVAETWTGGQSFNGYILEMRARHASHFANVEKLAMTREAPMGARTIARFMSEMSTAEVEQLVAPIKYAWIAIATGRDEVAAKKERADVLRALGNSKSPALAAWLRKLVDDPSSPKDEVRLALATQGATEDWPILVDGLSSESAATVEACAKALAAIDRKPDQPEPLRSALDAAARLGADRGTRALELAAHWTGEKLPAKLHDEWIGALQAQERAFRSRFPNFEVATASDETRPRWSFDKTLAFLERSAARNGSPTRGLAIFQKATCATCHPFEGVETSVRASGLGPDLATVTKRFDRKAILESIVYPSRVIADLYRSTVVITKDEERIEGRALKSDASAVELLLSDGSHRSIERSSIAQEKPSTISLMPEGLLQSLDLEDVKDLLAFLESGGKFDDADRTAASFEPMFSGKARNNWSGTRELWELDGELLTGTAKNIAQSNYLVSKQLYADFEVAFDVKISDGGNSGLQLRSHVEPNVVDPVGIQADLGESYWGSLYATDGRATLAPADAKCREVVDATGWNHVFIRCAGDRYTVELNGLTTCDAHDAKYTTGILAWQVHQGREMQVRVTNAKLRDLTTK